MGRPRPRGFLARLWRRPGEPFVRCRSLPAARSLLLASAKGREPWAGTHTFGLDLVCLDHPMACDRNDCRTFRVYGNCLADAVYRLFHMASPEWDRLAIPRDVAASRQE